MNICEWTLDKHIFDKETSLIVLCSDTVKEPAVPVLVGCKNKPFYYTGMLFYYYTYHYTYLP